MADLKLPQIPDRTPMKLSIMIMPDLHQSLTEYAALYASTYGREEPVLELVRPCSPLSWKAIVRLQKGRVRPPGNSDR